MSDLRLSTETQPGKPRDPFLDQQMKKIENAAGAINSALAVVSGIWSETSISADYSASVTDTAIFVDSGLGDVTVLLPAIRQGAPAGKVYALHNWNGANLVHVMGILPDLSGTRNLLDLAVNGGCIVCLSSNPSIGYRVFGKF